MSIAAIGAVFIGAEEEAATVVLLFLVGEMLEGLAASRARASIQGLSSLVPKTALVEKDGQNTEVPAESLAVGATILVRPGDRIPADGSIIEGSGEVDEAPVTGESVPRRKAVGDRCSPAPSTPALSSGCASRRLRRTTRSRASSASWRRHRSGSRRPSASSTASRRSTRRRPRGRLLVAGGRPFCLERTGNEWIYKSLAILLIGCPARSSSRRPPPSRPACRRAPGVAFS